MPLVCQQTRASAHLRRQCSHAGSRSAQPLLPNRQTLQRKTISSFQNIYINYLQSIILYLQHLQSLLNLRAGHEQSPEQSCPIVLNHRCDGQLVDSQVSARVPLGSGAIAVVEAIIAPEQVLAVIPVPSSRHCLCRSVGETGQCCRRRDHAEVIVRRVCRVAVDRVTGCQSPATVRIVDVSLAKYSVCKSQQKRLLLTSYVATISDR